ncbi:MAG: YihY/virulence factor BrkB family protein [Saprospiraceae bacterium]|nr:YihY/virulence factor BrkB family protein [Saprospiraceae bacterium]HRG68371.1 YihY/virulence factor BrkB family protein [Saprospiraceae bacterium]
MKKNKLSLGQRISQLPVTSQILDWTKTHSFPGFRNVPIFQVFSFLIQEARRNDLNMRASAMTYHFFLALFPSLIFFFTLTAYLPGNLDFYKNLEHTILSILPSGAKEYVITDMINSIRPQARSGLLSIGFILAIWFGSEGILSLMRGFDKTYKSSFRKRNWLERQMTAIAITFGFGILMIFSVLVIIFGEKILKQFLNYFKMNAFTKISITSLKYAVTLILFYSVIAIVYRYGPAIKKPIKGISPGALFATVASIITSILFGIFVDRFSSYHKIYGAISALIITLIWMRLNTLILILGFELNAAIVVNRDLMLQKSLNKRIFDSEDL